MSVNSIAPFSCAVRSILSFSPGETRYCLPPVRITAYIAKPSCAMTAVPSFQRVLQRLCCLGRIQKNCIGPAGPIAAEITSCHGVSRSCSHKDSCIAKLKECIAVRGAESTGMDGLADLPRFTRKIPRARPRESVLLNDLDLSVCRDFEDAATISGIRGCRVKTGNTSVSSDRSVGMCVGYPPAELEPLGTLPGIDSRTVLCNCRFVMMVAPSGDMA